VKKTSFFLLNKTRLVIGNNH